MASMNVVFRPSIREGRHQGSLHLRLIHRRQVKVITLPGCRLYEDEWNNQSQTIIFPENNPCRTEYLRKVESVIDRKTGLIANCIITLENQGRYVLDDLLGMYHEKKDDSLLSSFANTLATAMESCGQYRTAQAYRTVARGIVRFNKNEDIPLHHINSRLIKDFEVHLKERGRFPNTISFYIRTLRAIYNKAVAEKRIVRRMDENPFEGVKKGVTKTMKRSLSIKELQILLGLDFEKIKQTCTRARESAYIERLSAAYRYFAFCFYARGMCFIDLAFLKKSNIKGGVIRYVRKKTGKQIEVRITCELQTIINSFVDETAGSDYLFPIIRDCGKPARVQYERAMRVQNNRLKKLSLLAGIDHKISTHWARHSWATAGKHVNIPLSVISECLGHTSENTTMIYLAQLNNSVLDEANERIAFAVNR